jgi:hypothetical protein
MGSATFTVGQPISCNRFCNFESPLPIPKRTSIVIIRSRHRIFIALRPKRADATSGPPPPVARPRAASAATGGPRAVGLRAPPAAGMASAWRLNRQPCLVPREPSGARQGTAAIAHRNPRRSRAVCLMKIASPLCTIQEKNLLRRLSSEALGTRGAFVRCRRCALVPSDAVRSACLLAQDAMV